jgi:biopolymer transport protein ExbD
MRLKSGRPREEPDIMLVSFIDVVLMLLIFFILTTTFDRSAELGIELPEASAQKPAQEQALEIAVNAQGHYFLNGKPLRDDRPETVREALHQAIGSGKKPALTISADRMTPHHAVVTAMDAASQEGFEHLAIVTRHSP